MGRLVSCPARTRIKSRAKFWLMCRRFYMRAARAPYWSAATSVESISAAVRLWMARERRVHKYILYPAAAARNSSGARGRLFAFVAPRLLTTDAAPAPNHPEFILYYIWCVEWETHSRQLRTYTRWVNGAENEMNPTLSYTNTRWAESVCVLLTGSAWVALCARSQSAAPQTEIIGSSAVIATQRKWSSATLCQQESVASLHKYYILVVWKENIDARWVVNFGDFISLIEDQNLRKWKVKTLG